MRGVVLAAVVLAAAVVAPAATPGAALSAGAGPPDPGGAGVETTRPPQRGVPGASGAGVQAPGILGPAGTTDGKVGSLGIVGGVDGPRDHVRRADAPPGPASGGFGLANSAGQGARSVGASGPAASPVDLSAVGEADSAPAAVGAADEPPEQWLPGEWALRSTDGRTGADVTVDHELNLTPDRPGELRVTLRTRVPGDTGSVTVGLSNRATVVSTTGFDRRGGRYRLDGTDGDGVLTYRVSVNRTTASDEFEAVDAGPWALVRTPSPSVAVDGAGLERRYSIDGEGVVGQGLTYLGPHGTYDRSVAGQHVELVVPAAAELASRPTAIVDALSTAARTTRFGARDASVLFVAAPSTVDWAYAAQQVGDADAWVQDDQSLYDPRNAWLHEYVHTRQSFRATRETRWLVEGTATYYAALLSLRQGLVDFDEYRQHLLAGTAARNAAAVLADPGTWRGNRAEYVKGGLVVAALDRRIRTASDGERSFQWVLGRLNEHDGRVRLATLGSLAGAAGDRRVREAASRFATEGVAPDAWGADAHRAAFGWGPPAVSTTLADVRATGPAGARSFGTATDEVVVATGERLVANLQVENRGGRAAAYVAPFDVNFTTVNRTSGRVGAGRRTTVRVSHTFETPGTYYVAVGGDAFRVQVVEPASTASVTDVRVTSSDETAGETVTVVTQVSNRRDRPAQVSLPVSVDGEVRATRSVSIGPNQVRRVETTVSVDWSDRHRVSVAGESARLSVGPSGHVVSSTTPGPADTVTGLLSPTPAGGLTLDLFALLALTAVGGLVVGRRYWL